MDDVFEHDLCHTIRQWLLVVSLSLYYTQKNVDLNDGGILRFTVQTPGPALLVSIPMMLQQSACLGHR